MAIKIRKLTAKFCKYTSFNWYNIEAPSIFNFRNLMVTNDLFFYCSILRGKKTENDQITFWFWFLLSSAIFLPIKPIYQVWLIGTFILFCRMKCCLVPESKTKPFKSRKLTVVTLSPENFFLVKLSPLISLSWRFIINYRNYSIHQAQGDMKQH